MALIYDNTVLPPSWFTEIQLWSRLKSQFLNVSGQSKNDETFRSNTQSTWITEKLTMKCKCSRHRAKVNFTFVDSKLAFKSLDCQRSKFTLRRGHGHTNKRPSQHIKTSTWKPLKIMKRNKRRNTFPSPPPPRFHGMKPNKEEEEAI